MSTLAAAAMISERSTGTTVMPEAWSSFSLARMVWKAAGPGADGADPGVAQSADHPADPGEELEVLREGGAVEGHGVGAGVREGNAVLVEVVADGQLAAEGVAAVERVELVQLVVAGLHEDGHAQLGELQGVDHAELIAEVGQGHDDAVDLVAVLVEEVGALAGVGDGLDGPAGCRVLGQDDGAMAQVLDLAEQLLAAAPGQLGRKHAPGSDDQPEGQFLFSHLPASNLNLETVLSRHFRQMLGQELQTLLHPAVGVIDGIVRLAHLDAGDAGLVDPGTVLLDPQLHRLAHVRGEIHAAGSQDAVGVLVALRSRSGGCG